MLELSARWSRVWLVCAFIAPGIAGGQPNILLIIGDDMGAETLASYELGGNPPTTATLDQLARDGMRFTNFWAQPVCSPTRATIMTGRYGFRTGIGRPVTASGPMPPVPGLVEGGGGGMGMGSDHLQGLPRYGLGADEYALPMAFKSNSHLGYATAAIGKWHLADRDNGWLDHPNIAGFDRFLGSPTGGVESYFAWNKVVDGEVMGMTGYAPEDKTNDAIAWIAEQGDDPWFLWFAFNLPHGPLHVPPAEYWQSERAGELDQNAQFAAMLETMDTQIGRILDSMDPDVRENTYVIFLGDNGTSSGVTQSPFRAGRVKGSVYQGGVAVPLLISGPSVPSGTVSDALVNSTDLFVTIMELAGIDTTQTIPDDVAHDSISFLATLSDPGFSTRDWIYVDEFFGGFAGVETADYAMRDERYKLMRFNMTEEFYDLSVDPYEHDNLLSGELSAAEQAAYDELSARIERLRDSE